MTRFLYIADTHLGGDPAGFHRQPAYLEKLGPLVAVLDEWIEEDGDIEFVLHGGDMIHRSSADTIREARELFRLSVPVYLCLGNHDMRSLHAMRLWLESAPELFAGQGPEFSLAFDDCFLHVVPTQWSDVPYVWQETLVPTFLDAQLEWLDAALSGHPERIHVFATHGPVLGAPAGQTGFDEPFHDPGEPFSRVVLDLVRRHPQVRCVLSAHTHVNMHLEQEGAHFVTVSAFKETPFEFKLIEVERDMLRMATVNLVSRVDFRAEYDYDNTFVQGRAKDRAFEDRR